MTLQTQPVTFTGVASADIPTAASLLEAAIGELEAQAAAANTTALYTAVNGTVGQSLARVQAMLGRLQLIYRGL
jgi:hypothetical protein